MADRTLWLEEAAASGAHLTIGYGVDGHRFTTSLWWEGVDLDDLTVQIGVGAMRRVVFHIAAFEAMKATSLRPDIFDLGPYADLGTESFRSLWSTVQHHVWAQWRFEHDAADWPGPLIAGDPAPPATPIRMPAEGDTRTLLFCGGGKDSLVAGRVLEEAGVPYTSYAYSHSAYGRPGPQHELIDGLLDHLRPTARLRHFVFDDLLDAPLEHLAPELGLRSVTVAETPASLFGALPAALATGHADLVLAHERSADAGNLVWERTGETVNHQWGKSLEAELALRDHVERELVRGLTYSSVLKPVHDVVIFRALAEWADAVPATHSCNVAKPWCLRCAKCAYVWLGCRALLPEAVCDATFGTANLLDDVELGWFEQLLGLGDHTPFECVGRVDEARLYFELLRRRGYHGAAMRLFDDRIGPVDAARSYRDLMAVDAQHHAMPAHLAREVLPVLERLGALPLG